MINEKINIKAFAETVEIKIKLNQPIDGKEYIQFFPFTKDIEPELFDKLIQAVENSMNRQYQSLQKDIKKIVEESDGRYWK